MKNFSPQEFAALTLGCAYASLSPASLAWMPAPRALLSVPANIGTKQLWAAKELGGAPAAPAGCSLGSLRLLLGDSAASPRDAQPCCTLGGWLPAWVGFNQHGADGSSAGTSTAEPSWQGRWWPWAEDAPCVSPRCEHEHQEKELQRLLVQTTACFLSR